MRAAILLKLPRHVDSVLNAEDSTKENKFIDPPQLGGSSGKVRPGWKGLAEKPSYVEKNGF